VSLVDSIDSIDAVGEGRALRYGVYAPAGANINWMERRGSSCAMRTYERGVENETLSCGTGAVAAALVANQQWGLASPVSLEALGGVLEVAFEVEPKGFSHIVLTGPVARVFEGEWTA
jgi:diaminopimelate epimerase